MTCLVGYTQAARQPRAPARGRHQRRALHPQGPGHRPGFPTNCVKLPACNGNRFRHSVWELVPCARFLRSPVRQFRTPGSAGRASGKTVVPTSVAQEIMESTAVNPAKTPASLQIVGSMLFIPGLIGFASMLWHESLRNHGIRSGFGSFLEAHGRSVGALWTVGLFDLAAVAIGIACFRGSRWIRWAVPAFLGCLAVFGLVVGRPWESIWSDVWMVAALFYFFRSTHMVDYFNPSERDIPPNA